MERIWGFDLGTTSVGFTVIDYDEDTATGALLHQGVRIFPEGRTEKDLEPRNQARRAARLTRRQFRRRRLRRKLLRQAFAEAGLLPQFGTPDWHALMNPDESNPYALRARGLRQRLEPHQLGRALYHLAHRRGFLSARRPDLRSDEQKARKKEEGPVLEKIKDLEGKLAGRTLGEYLATDPAVERKRDRHIHRQMVLEEFDRLWEAQSPHHSALLTAELKQHLRSVLLYQRPIFWRTQTLGTCPLEDGAKVCPKGSWIGQQFLMFQHLNNVRVRFPGSAPRPLDAEERALVLEKLQRQAHMTFEGVRTPLRKLWKERGLPLKPEITLESGGEKKLLGNALEAHFVQVFGKEWESHPARDRLRAELFERLFQVDNRLIGEKRIELRRQDEFFNEIAPEKEQFIAAAQADFGLTREQAEQLAQFEIPTGWLRYSEKAIRKLLPYMEQGRALLEKDEHGNPVGAIDLAYPSRGQETGEKAVVRLPSHPKAMPELRNPSVKRVLNELRKVANNLLRAYGKPDRIRIELLRELKKTKKQRQEKTKDYRQQQERRQKAADQLREKGIRPNPDTIEKWLLWEECSRFCPYTGWPISFDALFRDGEFQVEHIFPLSRSLDNNYLNKTLCATDLNREKGDRTPFEFFRSNPEEWQEVKHRLVQWVSDGKFPREKLDRFLREDYPVGQEFIEERQKADTSYAAVEARKFLARLGVPVDVVSGPVTAQLRTQWNLNSILNPEKTWAKNRGDHRHHAVDALAVALTSPAFVKRLSDYYSRERRGEKPRFAPPWEGFHQEAERKTHAIVVSHRVQRKVSGPLHAQTYYGDTGQEITEGGITYRLFVTRKPLTAITKSQIEDIRDPRVKELVKQHVQEHGGDPKKAFPPYPALVSPDTGEAREIRKVRVLVPQQSQLMVPVRPAPKTFASSDNNHHIAIYRLENGEIDYRVVSLFEATQRLKTGEPIARRTLPSGGSLLMSLAKNDILEVPGKEGAKDYYVVVKLSSNGQIALRPHWRAKLQKAGKQEDDSRQDIWSPRPSTLLEMGASKVKVDPIGRLNRRAHD